MTLSQEQHNATTDDYGPLTRQQAENLADFAAERAEARIYAAVGRSVVRKVFFVVGVGGAALAAWVNGWFVKGPH